MPNSEIYLKIATSKYTRALIHDSNGPIFEERGQSLDHVVIHVAAHMPFSRGCCNSDFNCFSFITCRPVLLSSPYLSWRVIWGMSIDDAKLVAVSTPRETWLDSEKWDLVVWLYVVYIHGHLCNETETLYKGTLEEMRTPPLIGTF